MIAHCPFCGSELKLMEDGSFTGIIDNSGDTRTESYECRNCEYGFDFIFDNYGDGVTIEADKLKRGK